MRRAPAVLLILLVIYGFLSPPPLRSQDPAGPPAAQQARGFRLEQNTTNANNGETWIPFYLEESLFENGETRLVSIQIINLLNQVVAVPKVLDHPRGKNLAVTNLPYTEPGRKVVFWDGRDGAGRRAPSGVYYCQMTVSDQPPQMRKIIITSPRRRSRIPIPWFGRSRDRSE